MVPPGDRTHATLSGPSIPLRHFGPHQPLSRFRLSAAVYPVDATPIVDGAVLVDHGRITHVGPDDAVPAPDDVPNVSMPGTVVLPGLVNLHTHLELTGLAGRIEDDDFVDWIRHVRRAKERMAPEAFAEAARRGVRDAWRHGTTTVADTGDSGAVVNALSQLGGRGVVYHEVFGPDPADAGVQLRGLQEAVDRLRAAASETVVVGVSPHAPYTVSQRLFRLTAAWAREERLPVAVHIAESEAETALVTANRGPFAELWRRRGIPHLATARSPVAFLKAVDLLDTQPLAIHAVQIDQEDAVMLASQGCAVAACPRSNRRHGHGEPPVSVLHDAGVRFGIGTDSVASVQTLDLFAEAREIARSLSSPAAQTVRRLTWGGAECLGLETEVGALRAGMRADLLVLDLAGSADTTPHNMAERILASTPDAVRRTYVDGRLVYRRPRDGTDATRK